MTPWTIRLAVAVLGLVAVVGVLEDELSIAGIAVTAIAGVLPGARERDT